MRHPLNRYHNVNRSYGTNGLNQLTTSTATALSYDARGNLTTSGSAAYTYTSDNRMATGPLGAYLGHDAAGRLSASGLNTNPVATYYEYDGMELIAERASGGNVIQRRYVHGPGTDEPIVWYEGTGTTDRRFLHGDERGSVMAVSDGSGIVTNINRYDEYGIPAPTNVGRFQYTGQTWLPEVAMYYYKARIYSPTLGRFMQTDPIGYADGINWYDYVGGDPVNGVDPSGESVDTLKGNKLLLSGFALRPKEAMSVSLTLDLKSLDIKAPPGSPCLSSGGPCGRGSGVFGDIWDYEDAGKYVYGIAISLLYRLSDYWEGCKEGASNGKIDAAPTAKGAAQGAVQGAVTGGMRGGPSGAAAGAARGLATGAAKSAAKQACS